jgi:hypothetical protein
MTFEKWHTIGIADFKTLTKYQILNPQAAYYERVPLAGLEPARDCSQQILSLRCLPFHHSGFAHAHKDSCEPWKPDDHRK